MRLPPALLALLCALGLGLILSSCDERPSAAPFRARFVANEATPGVPLLLLGGARHEGLSIEFAEGQRPPAGSSVVIQGLTTQDGQPVVVEVPPEGPLPLLKAVVVQDRAFALRPSQGDAFAPMPIEARVAPGWVSIAPPLVAILLAVLLRQVLVALFLGIVAGTIVLHGSLTAGLFRAVDLHVVQALIDPSHMKIVIFSALLGAVVAMVARLGGMRAIVAAVVQRGQSRRGVLVGTWFMGIIVFFDDYANALLVGNTVRPISDRYRVSREKLAYLVDTTSAPVACISVISTWIVAQVGYIQEWLTDAVKSGGPDSVAGYKDAYQMFLDAIVHNYYPWLALFFAFALVVTGRSFGPMLRAERRAMSTGQLLREGAVPMSGEELEHADGKSPANPRWWNGVIPILTVVISVVFGLYASGIKKVANPDSLSFFERVRQAYGEANSYDVLIMASVLGLLSAVVLGLGQRLLSVAEVADTIVRGIKAMLVAILVLTMAWTLSDLCKALSTSGWLIQSVSLSFQYLPGIAFILAAVIGFSTGTSWGTMGILIPLTMAYAHQSGLELIAGAGSDPAALAALRETLADVYLGTIGAVLAGAVFGDHCSPISDTTVMSSMASGCDHIDHVKTQMPYALVVGAVALFLGYLPAGFGLPAWVSLVAGAIVLLSVILVFGRRVEPQKA